MPTPRWWISDKLAEMEPTQDQQASFDRIRAELATIGPCLPGSVVVRLGRCGKPTCSCRSDPPRLHGPFRSWTRKVAGKTRTRLLSDDQAVDYQSYFDNDRRLRALVHELEELTTALVEGDPRFTKNRDPGS